MNTRARVDDIAQTVAGHTDQIAELRTLVAQATAKPLTIAPAAATEPQYIIGSGGTTFVPTTWGTSATGAPPTGTVPEFVLTAVAAMLLVLTDHAASYEIHHGQDLDTHRQMLAEIGTLTDWLGGVLWDDAQARAVELYTRITT